MSELSARALPFATFAPTVAALFLSLGVVAGLIGSVFSIGRYLRNEGSAFYAL